MYQHKLVRMAISWRVIFGENFFIYIYIYIYIYISNRIHIIPVMRKGAGAELTEKVQSNEF